MSTVLQNDFLIRKGNAFDWDNDDLLEFKAVEEQSKLIHPDIISEIPGVETEDMFNGIIGPILIDREEQPLPYADRTAKVRTNTGLDVIDQA